MVILNDDMREMLEDFLLESNELLDNMDFSISRMEKELTEIGKISDEVINLIFRGFHSLKGLASFLELTNIHIVTHELENLLDLLRKQKFSFEVSHFDIIFKANDFLRQIILTLEKTGSDENFTSEANEFVKEIQSLILKTGKEHATTLKTEDGNEFLSAEFFNSYRIEELIKRLSFKGIHLEEFVSTFLYKTNDFFKKMILKAETNKNDDLKSDIQLFLKELNCDIAKENVSFTKDANITVEMIQRFAEESLELILNAEKNYLELEDDLEKKALTKEELKEKLTEMMRDFHSVKGNAGFYAYIELEKICHYIEDLLADCIQEGMLKNELSEILIEALDLIRNNLEQIKIKKQYIPFTEEKKNALLMKIKLLNQDKDNNFKNEQSSINKNEHNIQIFLDEKEKIADIQLPKEDLIISKNLAQENKEEKSVLIPKENEYQNEKNGNNDEVTEEKTYTLANVATAIRVDVEKIDSLLELVGEMVIAETMVSQNPDLVGLQLDRFEKAVIQLKKITRDIQDISMSMRMIPLAGIFQKMVRVVRDLTMKSGKKINLNIIGEETEVDKTIIEQISDPLVHIIRNAADHGLELIEERVKNGKAETGQITLEAKHAGGEVWIVVHDDGRGMDKEKIFKKAVERGLAKDDGREYKESDILKFIFEPGFSTAQQVTAISGRGVGMDVVRKQIEKLRGKVEISSEKGKGTSIILQIPLTLAIIEGMLVQVGHSSYTIPITSIRECFQPNKQQITITPEGLEVVNIRGELLPVIRLHEMYAVESRFKDLAEGILIIVESDARKYCIFVDELVGQQQVVIKALPEYIGSVKGVSGMAILGGGEVSMILDMTALIQSAEKLLEKMEKYLK